jgi:N,N-dimethylformamidase
MAIEGGPVLSVAREGARLGLGDRSAQVDAPILKGRWYELRLIALAEQLRLRQIALQRSWGVTDSGSAEMPGSLGMLRKLTFGAASTVQPGPHENPCCCFLNGRLEDPAILHGVHEGGAPIEPGEAECLAWWDFSAEIPSDRIVDRGPHGLHGHLRNLPTRAVRGSRWSGEETSWRHMPRHYAIHFHEDDLYDCGWETDFSVEIPTGMASGVYGIRLRCGDTEDIIPIYVLPPAGAATAPIVYLVPVHKR